MDDFYLNLLEVLIRGIRKRTVRSGYNDICVICNTKGFRSCRKLRLETVVYFNNMTCFNFA